MAIDETIVRRIMEYEEAIRVREAAIRDFEAIYAIYETEYFRATEEADWETMLVRYTQMVRLRGTITAIKGWITRFRKRIEELRKAIPPYKWMRMLLTFSVETGPGHEPFYAEVTLDTVIDAALTPEARSNMIYRIMNAAVKFFWIHFDAYKDIHKGEKLIPWVVRLIKHLTRIEEEEMDRFFTACIEQGKLQRDPDEYVTTQAIIKVGVEFSPMPEEAEPKYPAVDVIIETSRGYVLEKQIIMVPETKIDLIRLLEIAVERML